MAMGFAVTLRTARAQKIIDAIDAGSGAGTLKFYTATRPTTGGSVAGLTLLATVTFSNPCGTVTSGVLTFSSITGDSSADADGTATWARAADSDGTFVADLSVGIAGSAADIIVNTTAFVTGGPVSITSGTITEGNA